MNEIENAIDELTNLLIAGINGVDLKIFGDISEESFNTAISALEKQLNNGWIPVSERLPNDSGQFSVYVTIEYTETGCIYSAKMRWSYGEFKWFNGKNLANDCKIVAWMHELMPQPYAEVAK